MTKFTKLSLVALAFIGMNATAGTLQNVQKAGFLKCGVNIGATGF